MMMGGWGPMWGGFGWLGMAFGALVWLGILFVLVWAVLRVTSPRTSTEEDALEILKRRYARGEISRAEFEEARKALS